MTLSIPCFAKINEVLLVGGRDDRGYHPIHTIFQTVSLADDLTVSKDTAADVFRCSAALPDDNTVVRAWRLVREIVRLPPLKVVLEKHIPPESGLGGGSSDAAGFLRAANQITGGALPEQQLREIAMAVGADVPFFLDGPRAIGEGYGERLTPLPSEPKRWLLLVKPKIGCATREMYAALDRLDRPTALRGRDGNDFELVAPYECLELISELKEMGSELAGLSGSGAAVFGFFGSEAEANSACARCSAYWKAVAHTLAAYGGKGMPAYSQ